MRDIKGKSRYNYDISPDFLKLLARFRNDNPQIRFILEAAGYGNVEDYLDEAEQEEHGIVKKYFKDIFKKAG